MEGETKGRAPVPVRIAIREAQPPDPNPRTTCDRLRTPPACSMLHCSPVPLHGRKRLAPQTRMQRDLRPVAERSARDGSSPAVAIRQPRAASRRRRYGGRAMQVPR